MYVLYVRQVQVATHLHLTSMNGTPRCGIMKLFWMPTMHRDLLRKSMRGQKLSMPVSNLASDHDLHYQCHRYHLHEKIQWLLDTFSSSTIVTNLTSMMYYWIYEEGKCHILSSLLRFAICVLNIEPVILTISRWIRRVSCFVHLWIVLSEID